MGISIVFNTIVPMFAIIILGVFSRRLNLVPDTAAGILNFFINNIFFPILLFSAMAKQNIETILNYPFILAFMLVMVLTYAIAYMFFKLSTKDTPLRNTMKAFNSSCPNCAYIGIPLLLALYGAPGLIPAAIASILTIFMMAFVLYFIEKNEGETTSTLDLIKKTVTHVVKNPLIIGSVLGIFYAVCHFPYPKILDNFTVTLGNATIPCALLSIGLVLADKKVGHLKEVSIVSVMKLLIMPVIAIVLAKYFELSAMYAISLVLLSCLPTAVVDYIIADEYHQYVSETSATILVTTGLSIFAITLFIHVGDSLFN